ncbi:uncharacterized protein [Littorina saxatilis]|uniref:uncharacterized protein n=1 Tax=Littorina saxatilis TaxID=31220 RepID=UPI0038B62144
MNSSEEFNVTRDDTFSELMINRKIKAKDNGTLITCMRRDGAAAVNCSLRVIPHQYNLPQCVNNEVSVSGIAPWTTIRCEDLLQSHVIHWTVTDPHGNTSTVATCDRRTNGFNCTTCGDDYTVSRINESVSELMIVKEVREKAGSRVTCMRDNGKFAVSCNLHVIPYKLPQCQDGRLNVSDVPPWTPIRCEDLDPGQGVNWTITSKGTVSTIATCEDFNCTVVEDGFSVTGNNSTSELMITRGVKSKDNETLTCMRRDGAAAVDCILRVVPEADGNQDMQLFATVGGVLGAGVLIIVVVVVIVVITRRQKEGPRRPRKNFPENLDASFDDSNTEGYSRISDIVGDNAHNVMSVDNPCFIGTTASSVPMQFSTVSASALARNGNETQDLDEHTYTAVDLEDDVWKKGSGGPAENTGRVVILKQDPSAKTKRGALTGPDGYSDIDIQPDTHHVGAQGPRKVTFKEENSQGFPSPSNSPFKSKMHTASDEEDYSHLVINAAIQEVPNASKNVTFSNPDASEYSLAKVMPASTGKETPDDADAYNRIAITSNTADTQLQDTKNVHIENQDACSTLPAIATISNRDTERAAGEDPYDHIQADDYRHIVITSAKEEGAQASKNVASSNPNTGEYALAKVLPASTGKETPDDADAYNRIAITSNTADKQLQDTKNADIKNQDTGFTTRD